MCLARAVAGQHLGSGPEVASRVAGHDSVRPTCTNPSSTRSRAYLWTIVEKSREIPIDRPVGVSVERENEGLFQSPLKQGSAGKQLHIAELTFPIGELGH